MGEKAFNWECPNCEAIARVRGEASQDCGSYVICGKCGARAEMSGLTYAASQDVWVKRKAETKLGNPKDIAGETRVPMWLLSTTAKIAWAMAQFAGMLKYGAWNWRADGVRMSVYLSAIERHVEGLKNGEWLDPVDGTLHTGNIMACAAIITDAEAAGKLVDDRPPRLDHRPALKAAEELMVVLFDKYKDEKPKHWTINDPLP